jgi:hypothetical protein
MPRWPAGAAPLDTKDGGFGSMAQPIPEFAEGCFGLTGSVRQVILGVSVDRRVWSATCGGKNTASGQNAPYSNTSGGFNTATGSAALYTNATGSNNTADGEGALYLTTGSNNTAVGQNALRDASTGSNNIAVGYAAGSGVTTGSDNIDIGNEGDSTDGVSTDRGVIRIGVAGSQKEAFIAGIENSKVTGNAVYVTAGGRLGVLASSERYKIAIKPMGTNTAKLDQLRPVIFKLKSDSDGPLQYGLIAEEVAKVYPELVIRDQNGRIDGVRYDELAPMLLNEVQKQQAAVATLMAEHEADAVKLDTQAAKIALLEHQLAGIQAAIVKLPPQDQLVAQR